MSLRTWWSARQQATKRESLFVDLVTGHASARFTLVDVRSQHEREQAPVGAADVTTTVERLREGEPLAPPAGSELVVFGSDGAETEEAAAILRRRGYEVLSAPDGYATLKRHGLV